MKKMFTHQDLQMLSLKLGELGVIFTILNLIAGRSGETQLQLGENLNNCLMKFKSLWLLLFFNLVAFSGAELTMK